MKCIIRIGIVIALLSVVLSCSFFDCLSEEEYIVETTGNANLKSLYFDNVSLTTKFDPNDLSYNAVCEPRNDNYSKYIQLYLEKEYDTAEVVVSIRLPVITYEYDDYQNKTPHKSYEDRVINYPYKIKLDFTKDNFNVINIKVTSEDGEKTKSYKISIREK